MNHIDADGNAAQIIFGDSTDILRMPWEYAGGGGGINASAAVGYVALAGIKYSNNEDIRKFYKLYEQFLSIKDWADIPVFIEDAKQWVVETGVFDEPLSSIARGYNKIQNGFLVQMLPLPLWLDEVLGGLAEMYGCYMILRGAVKLVVEVGTIGGA